MNFDTNIQNYSIEEICQLLKIEQHKCDLANIFIITMASLEQINETPIPNQTKILVFFRQCFYTLCRYYKLQPTEFMLQNIEFLNLSSNEKNKEANKTETFVGALPTKVPEAVPATVSSNIDKYARGVVNPLQRETVNTILTINSKFRDYLVKDKAPNNAASTSSDFTVVLTDPINNVVSLKLASMELMNSYYAVSEYLKTNLFTVETYKINTNSGAITDFYSREIELSEGGYNSDLMVPTLNKIFTTDPSLNMVTSVYNNLKGRIIFLLSANPPVPPPTGTQYAFNLDFTIQEERARPLFLNYGWLLGFQKARYVFSTDYSTTVTPSKEIGFNSETPLDFTGSKFFLLEVTDYNNNAPAVLKYNTNDSYWFNIKDIIAKIPNVSSAYSVIFEDSSDRVFKTRNYFGPVKLQKLRIRLLDENGKVVNLNGSEMVVSFEVESLDVPYKNKI